MTTIIQHQQKRQTAFEIGLLNFLERKFKQGKGKWRVVSMKRKYKVKEDKSMFDVALGRAPEIAEVYLHMADLDYYVADVNEEWRPTQAFIMITRGLEDLKDRLEKETGMEKIDNFIKTGKDKIYLPKGA